jgi:3-hydroxyacyl-CoA dehydrogenase/enoyl-CoA hydratase/3-hydroxybutyryl-CoA epimerase
MLIEGVPPVMIENAAKMAGMPVGPLSLTDETAIDLAQKIMKQTIRDLGEKAVEARSTTADRQRWSTRMAARPQERQGLLRLPAKPAKKPVAGH